MERRNLGARIFLAMGNRSSLQKEEIESISRESGFVPAQVEALYSRFVKLDKGSNGSLSKEDFLNVPELAINPLCERIVHMFFADCDEDHERINFRQFMKILSTFKPSKPIIRHKMSVPTISLYRQDTRISGALDFLTSRKHTRHSSLDGFFENDSYNFDSHYTTNQHNMHYASATNLYQKNDTKNSPYNLDDPPNSPRRVLYFMFKIYDIDNDDRISLKDLNSLVRMMVGNFIEEEKIRSLTLKILAQADKDRDGTLNFDEFSNFFLDRDIKKLLHVKFPSNSSKKK